MERGKFPRISRRAEKFSGNEWNFFVAGAEQALSIVRFGVKDINDKMIHKKLTTREKKLLLLPILVLFYVPWNSEWKYKFEIIYATETRSGKSSTPWTSSHV